LRETGNSCMSIFRWFTRFSHKKAGKTESATTGYRAYCTDYDLVVPANRLGDILGPVSAENQISLNKAWDELLFGFAPLQAKWLSNSIKASRVLRASLSKQTREDMVMSLLIDHSGSMRGRSINFTAAAVDFVQDFLRHLGCKVEVLGYTTSSWKGGRSRHRWLRNGKPPNPGRLCDLLHIVYRSASDTRKSSLGEPYKNMLLPRLLKENVDGEAIEWAVSRLKARPEKHKFLLVISDGAPVDDSTLSANHNAYLWEHLKETIASVRAEDAVELMAIGIGFSVGNLYFNSVEVDELERLADVIIELLCRTIQSRMRRKTIYAPLYDQWRNRHWKRKALKRSTIISSPSRIWGHAAKYHQGPAHKHRAKF
jgi:cobaltochelatase CobT